MSTVDQKLLTVEEFVRLILGKVAEYLNAGVSVVCVNDPSDQTAYLYEGDRPVRILTADQDLTLPDLLGDFRVRVGALFD